MATDGQGWTLIARFSNNDTLNSMNDTGFLWYDKNDAFGGTTYPSNNTDMISPAFWLVSGNELEITRSDDPQHPALLQTTGDCLGGQTFRSKITSYGDFRNGNTWLGYHCGGSCPLQYGGQYEETVGFVRAKCDGDFQSANNIDFWCDGGWDGSVMIIGRGGGVCHRGAHGIGLTGAREPSFKDRGRGERDYGDNHWDPVIDTYIL